VQSDLINALDRTGERLDGWVAVLWTWLVPRMAALDDRAEKVSWIRERGLEDPVALPDLRGSLEALRHSDDQLADAACALVALERWIAQEGRPDTIHSEPVAGVDGELYYVTSWSSWLAEAFWEHTARHRSEPPATAYAPSIHILAPRLLVVPAVVDGISLEAVEPIADAHAWRSLQRVRHRFEAIVACKPEAREQPPRFVVHLAALGPNPLDGLKPDARRRVFAYTDPRPGAPTNAEIEASVTKAVEAAAAAGASILLFPELAIPIGCLQTLKEVLAATEHGPALTVAGLRHDDVVLRGEAALDDAGTVLSRWANEAIVLGDDGHELFRHRKLTAYAFDYEGVRLQEDTRLGSQLPILRSAVGNIAVLTCLDSFGLTADRLRQSYASLVLVPSLSGSVAPHRVALADAVRLLWGAAFVCNRAPTPRDSAGWLLERVRSFWSIALMNDCRPARQLDTTQPTFVFDLLDDRREFEDGP
jgi:hypothetical protein